MSLFAVVRILPHIKLKIFVFVSFIKERSKNERPNIKENKMLMEIFVCVLACFEIGSIKTEEVIHAKKAQRTGFIPSKIPVNAPAKAACAIVIPMNVIFSNNIQTPIMPQEIPQNTDIINALLKN